MDEAHENQHLELMQGKTCSREAVKKRQASAHLENTCEHDMVFLRRMLFLTSAVAVVALLTAAAALSLAISGLPIKVSAVVRCLANQVLARMRTMVIVVEHVRRNDFSVSPCGYVMTGYFLKQL